MSQSAQCRSEEKRHAPSPALRGSAGLLDVHVDPAAPDPQRGLERLEHAALRSAAAARNRSCTTSSSPGARAWMRV